MKLLNIYEVTYVGNNVSSKTLVHQVTVETKEELSEIVSLLNSKALHNKNNSDEEGYKGYVIELKSLTPAYKFINEFVNICEDISLVDYATQINVTYDNDLVMIK